MNVKVQEGKKVVPVLLRAVCVQSYLTLCSPTDCSPPDSSDHGILPARTQEWLPCPPLRDLPDPGMETVWIASLALEGGFFTTSTFWEAPSLLKFLFLNIYWGGGGKRTLVK